MCVNSTLELTSEAICMETNVTTQTRLPGRPYGTMRKAPGKTSTVHVPETTRVWLAEKMHLPLSWMAAHAPVWYDKMQERAEEARELRQEIEDLKGGIQKKDEMIIALRSENEELQRFKTKQLQAWRDASRQ